MNYCNIKFCDIAEGVGVRTTLFVSGCRRHCKGCFQPETWNFSYGEPFCDDTLSKILESLEPYYVTGLTLLGGEPFEPENTGEVCRICTAVKERFPQKSIWAFSGFTFEELLNRAEMEPSLKEILQKIDVLVDGPFVQELHDITLRFRGSKNQRIIDVAASMSDGTVHLWSDDPQYATHDMV